MSIQQMLLAGGSSSAGALDAWTANLWGAYSISKLIGSATSTSTATIGFNSSGGLDTTSLASLAGSNSVVVTEFANQQGTSTRKLTATGTQRPRIVNAGTYDGKLVFDGTNDGLVSGVSSTGANTGVTVFIRGLQRTTTGTQIMTELSSNFNTASGMAVYYDSANLAVGAHAPGFGTSNFSGSFLNSNVHAYSVDRTAANSTLGERLFINGTLQTRTGNSDTAPPPTSSFGALPWYVGCRGQASLYAALDLHTFVIYETKLSDADVASISAIIAAL
jgi:hypothetical protein